MNAETGRRGFAGVLGGVAEEIERRRAGGQGELEGNAGWGER